MGDLNKVAVYFLLCSIQATIHYKPKAKSYQMTPTRKRICKPLIRKNYTSFAKRCVQNVTTKKVMVKSIARILEKEVTAMCSDKFNSILKTKSKDSLENFEVRSVMNELTSQAPTLLSLLRSCMKSKMPHSSLNLMITTIVAMMCKHRRSKCSLTQRMNSLILYAGHSAKQVSLPLPPTRQWTTDVLIIARGILILDVVGNEWSSTFLSHCCMHSCICDCLGISTPSENWHLPLPLRHNQAR